MICPRCSSQIDPRSVFCTVCGLRIQPPLYTTPQYPNQTQYQPQYRNQPPYRSQPPYGNPQQYGHPQQMNMYPPPQQVYEDPTIAILAIVLAFIFSPAGLVFGIIGMNKYKVKYRGVCIIAIILSSVAVFFLLFYFAIMALAISLQM